MKSIVSFEAKPSWIIRLDQDLRSTLRDCGGFRGVRRVEDWEKGEGWEKERGEGRGKGEDPFCYDVVDVGSVEEVLEGDVWWVQVYVL